MNGGSPAPLALVDCNNFYCSCERVFDRRLEGVPVIVLSNNDGCAIARSQEAKLLGIRMGEPVFKLRELIRRHGVRVLSSNYALYGDMSRRVNEILSSFSDTYEIYSIDETFVQLAHAGRELEACGRDIRRTLLRDVGIPTCVGIGPTKTLAKVANAMAKKTMSMEGVCSLMDEGNRRRLLAQWSVGDVWGIGRATEDKLRTCEIETAGQLANLPIKLARQVGGVVLERIVLELQGIPCIALENVPAAKKGTAVTRSFGRAVRTIDEVLEAITKHASRAGEKLRREGLVAGRLTAFAHTSPHGSGPFYHGTRTATLVPMTCDTRHLVAAARRCIEASYRDGFAYAKAGVILDDLRPESEAPLPLLPAQSAASLPLMSALDAINARFGRGAVRLAAQGVSEGWGLKSDHKSPCYTTQWNELPIAKAH